MKDPEKCNEFYAGIWNKCQFERHAKGGWVSGFALPNPSCRLFSVPTIERGIGR